MKTIQISSNQPESALACLGTDKQAARLLRIVSKEKRVPLRQILTHSRNCRRVAMTRQLAMYLTHVMLGRTLTDVGALYGRDRTTVAHACAKIEDMRDYPRFEASVSRLETTILKRIVEKDLLHAG